jgi:hypothetical protein
MPRKWKATSEITISLAVKLPANHVDLQVVARPDAERSAKVNDLKFTRVVKLPYPEPSK